MADKSNPVENALQALDKRLSGLNLTEGELGDLTRLESSLGLKRPLADYAPRTRRRYTKAAREGMTAKGANRREYERRPSLDSRIDSLADFMGDAGYGPGLYNKDSIRALVESFGKTETARLLAEQKKATEAYLRGDKAPGQRLWMSLHDYEGMDEEKEFLQQLKQQYGKYHGRR